MLCGLCLVKCGGEGGPGLVVGVPGRIAGILALLLVPAGLFERVVGRLELLGCLVQLLPGVLAEGAPRAGRG